MHEKPEILEGKCHGCEKWVGLEGVKVGDVKVRSYLWECQVGLVLTAGVLLQVKEIFWYVLFMIIGRLGAAAY